MGIGVPFSFLKVLKGAEVMGIRFFCPNGHKLNVKEHLAGKTGFCPECGVRLVILYQSTRKSSRELGTEKGNDESPFAVPVPGTAPSFSLEGMPQQNAAENAQAYTMEAAPAAFPAPTEPAIANPILNDQTVVWYIQVPDGGPQYGPATGQVVNAWIQERRIAPAMLVWREGWSNWLEAKDVFPELLE